MVWFNKVKERLHRQSVKPWIPTWSCRLWNRCQLLYAFGAVKLNQVVFICQLLKSLLHRSADIYTDLEVVMLLFHINFAPWSPFSVNVRKLPLVTGYALRAKVTILLLFHCVGSSKHLVHLVLTKVRVCSPPRWVSSSPKFILAQRELAIP